MSGRYAFSLPEPRQRDGWFRIGPVDMTTTAIIVALSVGSMVAYALSPDFVFKGAFVTELIRHGEVWRMVTWPIVNPPVDVWALVGVAIYWFLGHMVEDEIGKRPMAWLCLAMAVIPTAIVTLLNVANDAGNGRWSAYSYTVFAFSLVMITIFGLEHPNARFFFGIPAWVISAAFVFIEIMRDV